MAITSPNMGLQIPAVGVEIGPDWAYQINQSLNILDGHTHQLGNGVQITPSAINMTQDLNFLAQNAINLRSVRLNTQLAPLATASDSNCLYTVGNNLYYNYNSSTPVQITNGASIVGAAGTISGLPSGTASAAYSGINGTFTFQQATSTAANADIGSLILRYPGSYPVPSGNYILLQVPSALPTGYSLTLPVALPANNNSIIASSTAGTLSYLNVDNSTLIVSGSTLAINSLGVQQANIYKRTLTSTATVGNVARTVGLTGSTSSTTPASIASMQLATTGRPVFLMICNGLQALRTYLYTLYPGYLVYGGLIDVWMDGVYLTGFQFSNPGYTIPQFVHLPSAGNHTYEMYVSMISGATSFIYTNIQMVAYEL